MAIGLFSLLPEAVCMPITGFRHGSVETAVPREEKPFGTYFGLTSEILPSSTI